MKRNTMRVLTLALALVMLLSAVPFASAAVTIEADPGTTVWEGTSVDLLLNGNTSNEKWSTNELNKDAISVRPTATTTYTVEYTEEGVSSKQSKSITIEVLKKTGANFAINETTAIVGEELTLTTTGAGDSAVEFSGDGVTGNKFTATAAGTYTVTATAENDPDDNTDDVTVRANIVASVATYKVTVDSKTISQNDKNTYVTFTTKKGSETVTASSVTYAVTAGSNVATVSTAGLITPKAEGSATVKVTATFADGATAYGTGTITVSSSGVVYLEQDGEATDDDSIDLEFSVVGPGKKEEVTWEFSVSALNIKSSSDKSSPYFTWYNSKETDKRKYEVEEDGPEIEVELQAKKGHGIALINVDAYWTNSRTPDASGVFYVSFYDEVDYEVTVKDDVDEFDWDDNDVFSAAKKDTKTYTATELKSLNLAELLTLDAGTYIDLDEGKEYRDNEDVGEITANKKLNKWDNEDVNTYEMDDLEYLTFEVDDEGTFYLEYIQYDKVTGYGDELVIGEGTIEINVGKGDGKSKKGDINYNVKNKGEVELDEDDFEDFWDEYCDDEDIDGKDAEFGYVVFDYKATKINGTMYGEGGDKSVKNTYYYHFDYDEDEDDSSKDFDLNDMIYEASTTKTDYIDEIDFTCYSENGDEEVDGTLTFTVGEGEEDDDEEETTIGTMSFTDVKSTDWYYASVKYVYENGIMAGTSTTKFSPDTNLTRGMIVTMLYRVEGQPTVSATNKFSDVKNGDYFYDAVRWAAQNGIVNGTTATTFSPNTNITRQDLATILYRYVKEYKNQTASLGALTGFADASQVSDYASSAMKWAVGAGIINGSNGSLLPKGNATRAQAAAMFERLLSK
ncbi:MAG: S-layer homology domain-containing protein [Oscillospiraceae bacterium]|nr:S-layer homology domain-containing protein [Oscillospiraceae bacterium]